MTIIDRFEDFAAEFESAVQDDNWARLEKYLTPDATYLNVGGPDPIIGGRKNILAYLQKDVSENDRQFDSRTHTPLTPPEVDQNRLTRRWRCTYTLSGAPDLVVEGQARYLFDGNLIKAIEEEVTPESLERYQLWMQENGSKLPG